VNTDPRTGKVKFASAHDLRRSFGERWASRVRPQVLMELMRDESIDTTLRFFVGRNAQATADVLGKIEINPRRRNNSKSPLRTLARLLIGDEIQIACHHEPPHSTKKEPITGTFPAMGS
jgi:hypothetical protein